VGRADSGSPTNIILSRDHETANLLYAGIPVHFSGL
jgi:hypothetical protein